MSGAIYFGVENLTTFKVTQNGVKPFLNEIVKKSCFNVDLNQSINQSFPFLGSVTLLGLNA